MYLLQPETQTATVQPDEIHIHCPDIICHAAASAGDSIVQSVTSYFANVLFDGVNDGLKSVLTTLQESSDASFTFPYFITVYNRLFALMLVMSVLVLIGKSMRLIFSKRHTESWVSAATGVIRYLLVGIVLPFIVGTALIFSQMLSNMAASIPMVSHHTGWQDTLLTPYAVVNIAGTFALRFFMASFAGLLQLQLNLLKLQLFFVTLFALVAFASDPGTTFGKRLRNISKSLIIVMVFAKPVMIFWIAFSAQIISVVPAPASAMATYVLLIEISAAFVPFVLFVLSMKFYIHLDNEAQIRGEVYTNPNDVSSAQYQADLAAVYNARVRAVSENAKAKRRQFVGAAANTAVDTGMTKAAVAASNVHPAAKVAVTAAHTYIRYKRRN